MPSCKECRWWKPDVFFAYIGECEKIGRVSQEDKSCNDFELKHDADFMWCRDCRITIHRSERVRHKGHGLFGHVHVDYDAHEYTSAGD